MAVQLRKLSIIVGMALVTAGLLVTGDFFGGYSSKSSTYTYKEKSVVSNKSLFVLTPKKEENTIHVALEIEAFQQPEILDLEFSDYVIVTINDEVCENLKWELGHKKENRVDGKLRCLDAPIANPESLSVELFFNESILLSWSLSR